MTGKQYDELYTLAMNQGICLHGFKVGPTEIVLFSSVGKIEDKSFKKLKDILS